MAVFEIYSKRQKRLKGEVPEVYVFDRIDQKTRVQIVHIIKDAIGIDNYGQYKARDAYKFLNDTLCREYGLFQLNAYQDPEPSVLNFFLQTNETDKALDVIELAFTCINVGIRKMSYSYTHSVKVNITPDEAVQELNCRLRENGIGFQYENHQLIRFDSTYIHTEVVKPSIALLWNKKFEGANNEYMKAHDHYKNGRNKECLSECLKAFESTMKIICTEKKWQYSPKDTAAKLIQVCLDNNLVPPFLQTQFSSLRVLMESGVPTVRNNLGGHGQGQSTVIVNDQIARYALNLTGANIILLIEQSEIR